MQLEVKPGLYDRMMQSIDFSNDRYFDVERLAESERNIHFAMNCNGFFLRKHGGWDFKSGVLSPMGSEYKGQATSFYGPVTTVPDFFSTTRYLSEDSYLAAFDNPKVQYLLGRLRYQNVDIAARVAFILGGVVRAEKTPDPKNVEYVAKMSNLGEKESVEAIASAMAMYVLSGGSLEDDRKFTGKVYNMAEAIAQDPIIPFETMDLGLSQVSRLRMFFGLNAMPDINEQLETLDGFPTTGAEFHFPMSALDEDPDLWKKLALLNMSQYQKGSYVQMSRNDRDVIEVRMNPSVYPVTVANWRFLRHILPQLDEATFFATFNRRGTDRDFSWANESDADLLNKLRGLGLLSYAGLYNNVPTVINREEIPFGNIYLGQTVRIHEGQYRFTGNWGGTSGEGVEGQLSIYTGFGENLKFLVYYPSMAIANPTILRAANPELLKSIKTIEDALGLDSFVRSGLTGALLNTVQSDRRLSIAHQAGEEILELLSPPLMI